MRFLKILWKNFTIVFGFIFNDFTLDLIKTLCIVILSISAVFISMNYIGHKIQNPFIGMPLIAVITVFIVIFQISLMDYFLTDEEL